MMRLRRTRGARKRVTQAVSRFLVLLDMVRLYIQARGRLPRHLTASLQRTMGFFCPLLVW